MSRSDEAWEAEVKAVWALANELSPERLVEAVDALADERAPDDANALFERACARDTAGYEYEAEPFYRAALASGKLDPYRSTRASIQLASTLRILGQFDESEALLVAELDRHMLPGHDRALHDEARAILALTYVAQGREREAAGLALCVLAPKLSRYNRSMLGNALPLVKKSWT
ncbi:tetratricopeptide repeat protein [soil metagenome]